jgi:glycosyltransferase involved in cell wall biosynthesis
LGRQQRGAETFTAECFAALRGDPRLDLFLARGAGAAGSRILRIRHLPRDTPWAIRLGTRLGGDGYTGEQWSFVAGLVPQLLRLRPDVVYLGDRLLCRLLHRWRRISRSRFRLLLRNEAPFPAPFPEADFVQQLTTAQLELGLEAGESSSRQALVPYGFFVAERSSLVDEESKRALRRRLGLPEDPQIVLSVGVLDSVHKGHDRLIRGCALAECPSFLVLLGARAEGTPLLEELGHSLLGPSRMTIRTVEPADISAYYRAADIFVLASLREGFGRAYVEAAGHGLRCIVHREGIAKEVLGEWGTYVDAADEQALAVAIDEAVTAGPDDDAVPRRQAMIERYDWRNLTERYVELFRAAAAVPTR